MEKAKQYKGLDNKFYLYVYYAIHLYAKFIIRDHVIFERQFMLILWSDSYIDIDIWNMHIYMFLLVKINTFVANGD